MMNHLYTDPNRNADVTHGAPFVSQGLNVMSPRRGEDSSYISRGFYQSSHKPVPVQSSSSPAYYADSSFNPVAANKYYDSSVMAHRPSKESVKINNPNYEISPRKPILLMNGQSASRTAVFGDQGEETCCMKNLWKILAVVAALLLAGGLAYFLIAGQNGDEGSQNGDGLMVNGTNEEVKELQTPEYGIQLQAPEQLQTTKYSSAVEDGKQEQIGELKSSIIMDGTDTTSATKTVSVDNINNAANSVARTTTSINTNIINAIGTQTDNNGIQTDSSKGGIQSAALKTAAVETATIETTVNALSTNLRKEYQETITPVTTIGTITPVTTIGTITPVTTIGTITPVTTIGTTTVDGSSATPVTYTTTSSTSGTTTSKIVDTTLVDSSASPTTVSKTTPDTTTVSKTTPDTTVSKTTPDTTVSKTTDTTTVSKTTPDTTVSKTTDTTTVSKTTPDTTTSPKNSSSSTVSISPVSINPLPSTTPVSATVTPISISPISVNPIPTTTVAEGTSVDVSFSQAQPAQ